MAGNFLQSEVIDNQKFNSKFNLIRLKAKDSAFKFEAGQFTVIKIDDTVSRAYSIVSLPQTLPYWEIFVDITPGGPGTTMIKKLKPGDIIHTSQPRGTFKVEKDGAKKILMGATGCGMAAIKPVLEELLNDKERQSIQLFWGLRHEEEICFLEHLKKLQEIYPHFNYEIVISKPQNGWTGKTGHITSHLDQALQNHTPGEIGLYLCGNSEMIKETIQLSEPKGLTLENIYFERHY